MGFRNGAYLTIWEVLPQEKFIKVRGSTSRKNKESGEYITDFSGFVAFIGAARDKAKNLAVKDRIKISECEVTNRFDKLKNQTFTNFTVFDYEPVEYSPKKEGNEENAEALAEKKVEEIEESEDLPF